MRNEMRDEHGDGDELKPDHDDGDSVHDDKDPLDCVAKVKNRSPHEGEDDAVELGPDDPPQRTVGSDHWLHHKRTLVSKALMALLDGLLSLAMCSVTLRYRGLDPDSLTRQGERPDPQELHQG